MRSAQVGPHLLSRAPSSFSRLQRGNPSGLSCAGSSGPAPGTSFSSPGLGPAAVPVTEIAGRGRGTGKRCGRRPLSLTFGLFGGRTMQFLSLLLLSPCLSVERPLQVFFLSLPRRQQQEESGMTENGKLVCQKMELEQIDLL